MVNLPLRRALLGAGIALLAAVGAIAPASASPPQATVLVATGLSSPKGLTLDKQHQPIVSQGAFGPPGPIVRFRTVPPSVGSLEAISPVVGANGVAYVRKTNTLWVLGGDGKLYRQKHLGQAPQFVADLTAFAATHPDPDNNSADGPADESNPFGVTALSNGNAIVTDAAANSILRVTPSGKIALVAHLPRELVSTSHLPPGQFPPTLPAEAVPTGVTIGPDGHIYVAELKGFPFRPGTSRIWRIEPNATNAVCSINPKVKPRNCKLYGSGYTSIGSIAFDAKGRLYVFEYAAGGAGAFEDGCDIGQCPPAVLLQVSGGVRKELAAGELQQPGWLAPTGSTLYLTDSVLTGGRLLRLPIP